MFKYVPVLRYQQEEKAAFKLVKISNKVLPLIELIHGKGRKETANNFKNYYSQEFENLTHPILVDIPLYIKVSNSTKIIVRSFLEPIIIDPSLRINYFNSLKKLNIIPVISYPIIKNIDPTMISFLIRNEYKNLLEFNRLAYRLFEPYFNEAITEIAKIIRKQDILIFDINKEHHRNDKLKKYYNIMIQIKKKIGCKIVLIKSAINNELTNGELPHDRPVAEYDNSLLKDYSALGFDAFGDFCGIKKDNLTQGGPGGTCGFVFYNWDDNNYIGFRGNTAGKLTEYTTIIVPSIVNSKYFKYYQNSHTSNCPGCKIILNAFNNPSKERVNGFAKWKRIAASHYLYTMETLL